MLHAAAGRRWLLRRGQPQRGGPGRRRAASGGPCGWRRHREAGACAREKQGLRRVNTGCAQQQAGSARAASWSRARPLAGMGPGRRSSAGDRRGGQGRRSPSRGLCGAAPPFRPPCCCCSCASGGAWADRLLASCPSRCRARCTAAVFSTSLPPPLYAPATCRAWAPRLAPGRDVPGSDCSALQAGCCSWRALLARTAAIGPPRTMSACPRLCPAVDVQLQRWPPGRSGAVCGAAPCRSRIARFQQLLTLVCGLGLAASCVPACRRPAPWLLQPATTSKAAAAGAASGLAAGSSLLLVVAAGPLAQRRPAAADCRCGALRCGTAVAPAGNAPGTSMYCNLRQPPMALAR
jgi:hypothetical protein